MVALAARLRRHGGGRAGRWGVGEELFTSPTTITTPGVRTVYVLPVGQAKIRGTARTVAADAERVPIVPPPLTIDVPAWGRAAARSNGPWSRATRWRSCWDGGRPLAISGGAGLGLDTGPAHIESGANGLRIALDGAPASPGTYRIRTTVAVGAAGGLPQDSVDFESTSETASATHGGATVGAPPGPSTSRDRARYRWKARSTVETREGTRHVATVIFGPGSFLLSLSPVTGGWDVNATVQGPLQAT